MKGRHLGFAALIFSAELWAKTPVELQQPRQKVTLDYLLESCAVVGETAGGLIQYFDCESYLYGLLDTQRALNAQLPAARRVCIPDNLPVWKLYQQLPQQISDSARMQPAAPWLLSLWQRQYPCAR